MYRSPAALEPSRKRDAVLAVSAEIDALRTELVHHRAHAERTQRHADATTGEYDALVARAEEARRRALLRALASAPQSPQADGVRAALRAERRERDLRTALARAQTGREGGPRSRGVERAGPAAGVEPAGEPDSTRPTGASDNTERTGEPDNTKPTGASDNTERTGEPDNTTRTGEADTTDARATMDALHRAREARARAVAPALAAARDAAMHLREVEHALDDLERERARLEGTNVA